MVLWVPLFQMALHPFQRRIILQPIFIHMLVNYLLLNCLDPRMLRFHRSPCFHLLWCNSNSFFICHFSSVVLLQRSMQSLLIPCRIFLLLQVLLCLHRYSFSLSIAAFDHSYMRPCLRASIALWNAIWCACCFENRGSGINRFCSCKR